MTKKSIIHLCGFLFIVVFLSVTSVLGGVIISEFLAENGQNQVTLKWKVRSEKNIKGYEVERSLDGNNFERLDLIKAKENSNDTNEYSYVDRSVFKSSSYTFTYRLKILENEGAYSYSKTLSVTPHTSGVGRFTWGSIKAMFR